MCMQGEIFREAINCILNFGTASYIFVSALAGQDTSRSRGPRHFDLICTSREKLGKLCTVTESLEEEGGGGVPHTG